MAARGETLNDMASNGEVALIRDVVGAGGTMLWDVGANLGDWSEAALAIAPGISLHAFEPVPATFDRLQQRLSERGAKLHRLALSSHAGSAPIHLAGSTAGTNSLVAQDHGARAETIEVSLERSDTLADREGVTTIHLLKIDAEGHDFAVLEGASGLFETHRIWVAQFEYNWRWLASGRSLQSVFALADRWGYRVARVTPAGLEVMDDWNQEADRFFECNYALVEPQVLPHLRHRIAAWDRSNTLA